MEPPPPLPDLVSQDISPISPLVSCDKLIRSIGSPESLDCPVYKKCDVYLEPIQHWDGEKNISHEFLLDQFPMCAGNIKT